MSFNFDFKLEHIEDMLKGNKETKEWYDAMVDILPKYDINTPARVAGFVAQCGHESNNFTVLTENLNYSAKALDSIFGKYFKRAGRDAEAYHRQPEKIANVIYAGRMDNNDSDSGDGWCFRGGGILQLTGRSNYTAFGKSVGKTPEQATEYVRTKEGALASACWFWQTNNINKYCDSGDIVGMTKRINGGTIGLEDRKAHYEHAIEVLTGSAVVHLATVEVSNPSGVLRKGSKGDMVKKMQEVLGLDADGDFGPGTERAVKAWQAEHNLTADGIVGPATMKAMGM
jgi:putative chitinase